MRILTAALFLVAVAPWTGSADTPPDPCVSCTLDETGTLLLIPDEGGDDPHPLGTFSLTIWDFDCVNPIVGAIVEVLIGGQADGKIAVCEHAELVRVTDETGSVTFNIPGGGCYRADYAVEIRANGVTIRQYHQVLSPDYAGWDNEGIPDRWDHGINPVDLAAFAAAYQGGAGAMSCHDYNSNGFTDPTDLTVFSQVWSGGTRDCAVVRGGLI